MSRNTLKQWKERQKAIRPAKRRKFVPRTGREPRRYRVQAGPRLFYFMALTKSEARALAKRIAGTLPRYTVVTEVA